MVGLKIFNLKQIPILDHPLVHYQYWFVLWVGVFVKFINFVETVKTGEKEREGRKKQCNIDRTLCNSNV